jgi:chromosome segregation ATPase
MNVMDNRLASALLLLCTVPVWLSGCAWKKDLDEARLQADEYRLQLEDLRKQTAGGEGVAHLRAQRDRLTAENKALRERIAQLDCQQHDCEARLAAGGKSGSELTRQQESQRKELEAAIANLRISRQQWEETLADRQRQIEVLTSRIESLRKELDTSKAQSRPASGAS